MGRVYSSAISTICICALSLAYPHTHTHTHRLLSVVESMDNGKPIRESRDCDIPLVARHFYHHSGKHSGIPLAARNFYHHSGKHCSVHMTTMCTSDTLLMQTYMQSLLN